MTVPIPPPFLIFSKLANFTISNILIQIVKSLWSQYLELKYGSIEKLSRNPELHWIEFVQLGKVAEAKGSVENVDLRIVKSCEMSHDDEVWPSESARGSTGG